MKTQKEKYSNRVSAHIIYKLKDGTIVPGVTTITESLGWNKRALIKWANNLGLKGIDSAKYAAEKAEIGILAHLMITDYLQGIKTDTSEYSRVVIDQAENSVLSFFEWLKRNKLEPHLIEEPLISEKYKYGGTMDIYGMNNGHAELIDLKTGSGIYDEYTIQVAALENLLIEADHKVERRRILNIPRSEDESFQEKIIADTNVAMKIFLDCLDIYNLKKQLAKGG